MLVGLFDTLDVGVDSGAEVLKLGHGGVFFDQLLVPYRVVVETRFLGLIRETYCS